jgi:putative SOS response-associated peptidase YedK
MCGRFSLYASPEEVARVFAVSPLDASRILATGPRFNIAPTTAVAAVRHSAIHRAREIVLLRWGLIPSWAKEAGKGPLLINARAETVAEKPSFRSSFRLRRCLVIADGFFEWQKLSDRKQPYHFQVDDGAVFAFAAIWDRWERNEGDSVESCAILTTRSNQLMSPIHDRMPVILASDTWETWLRRDDDDRKRNEELQSLLSPFPADRMRAFPVSALVSSPRTDVPDCVVPAGPLFHGGDSSG